MAKAKRVLYPIGIQTFEEIRKKGYFYADKTEYIYNMTHESAKYQFLSRPRRFGKSLLVSTLKSYFEGRRDLFQGLAMEQLEEEWTQYPVLHFSLGFHKMVSLETVEQEISRQLLVFERQYGVVCDESLQDWPNFRLTHLVNEIAQKTRKHVVLLLDDMDDPLKYVLNDKALYKKIEHTIWNFLVPLKALDAYLEFFLMVGETEMAAPRYEHNFNNVVNASLNDDYATLCGITKDELLAQMTDDIDALAEAQGMTREEAITALEDRCGGYRFAWPSPTVFNPSSLFSALENRKFDAYQLSSGTSTYLLEAMRKFQFKPTDLLRLICTYRYLTEPIQIMTSAIPLLYQSGYFAIKDYERLLRCYYLDVPNKEVRNGMLSLLISCYMTEREDAVQNAVADMMRCLRKDDMDGALRLLQTFLSTVPYCDNTHYEGHWQQVLFIIFSLLGNYCDVEVHTAQGRVDLVMATKTRLYIIETKLGETSEKALAQIKRNEYDKRFALYELPKVKVGINFDVEKHTLTDWTIEEKQ